ncbi:MAG: filamentous hemagglutinin N-terminal domain-containing protein, partial [Leptolyngbyaceae cyanobacterium MO_188.B28]|nr:filamentous hemagglutinin N-terminal domain-containing protein [Leptolyngbyaceae cyanobacterium MO_188.B28]
MSQALEEDYTSVVARFAQFIGIASSAALSGLAIALPAAADVIPNGLGTTVPTLEQSCTATCNIRNGTTQGTNLFHSFQEFSIPTGGTAAFIHDASIQNIITRVTGGAASNIDGTISALGDANLFLINPSGIVFGPNATLNIGGSFMGSTAEGLTFSDGAEFNVTDTNPTLSINVPVGLQFGANPGNIQVQGNGNQFYLNADATVNQTDNPSGLAVQPSQTLALVGGAVTLEGAYLNAEAGRIELGSVGEAGLVNLTAASPGWSLDYGAIQNFQDIRLSQTASLDVSGDNAGAIQLQGRQLNLSDGSSLLAVTEVNGGGEIILRASESIQMTGMSSFEPPPVSPNPRFNPTTIPTSAYVEIAPGANGDGSSLVTIETPRLEFSGGAQIGLSMAGSGSSGTVNVRTQEVIADGSTDTSSFSGLFTAVLSSFPSPGQGGELSVETDRLQLTNGAQIRAITLGGGDAGNLTVQAQDIEVIGFNAAGPSLLSSTSEIPPAGSGGDVTIETARLLVADGGQISTGTASFTNPAGDLTVNASESIELRGTGTGGRSGLFGNALFGVGSGGNINVETDQLIVRDGATINVSNFPSSPTSPIPSGRGPAGNLTVNADSILLDNQAILTADTVDGDRANINLQADGIVLRRGSLITT